MRCGAIILRISVMRESSLTGLESCNAPDSDGKQCFCLECSTWTLASFCLMSAGLPALNLLRRPQAHHTQCSRYEWEPLHSMINHFMPRLCCHDITLEKQSTGWKEVSLSHETSLLICLTRAACWDFRRILGTFGKDFVYALKCFNQDVFQSSCSDKMAHDKTGIVAQLIARCQHPTGSLLM